LGNDFCFVTANVNIFSAIHKKILKNYLFYSDLIPKFAPR
jgi:hypothetical protein